MPSKTPPTSSWAIVRGLAEEALTVDASPSRTPRKRGEYGLRPMLCLSLEGISLESERLEKLYTQKDLRKEVIAGQ